MIELPVGAVHLWRASVVKEALEDASLTEVLDAQERLRAGRFRSDSLRRDYVSARGQLRWLLARYLSVAPGSIRFVTGAHGKPYLAGMALERGVVFNLSHSGPHLLIAVTREASLGVDIELWRELGNLDGMARRCLAPSEQRYWSSCDADNRLSAFYAFWTCKESFVKAVGRGLALGVERCVVELVPQPRFVELPPGFGAPCEWLLNRIDIGPGLSAALALRPSCGRRIFLGALKGRWWHDNRSAGSLRPLK